MSVLTAIHDFIREYRAIMDHARTGHAPQTRTRRRPGAIDSGMVDGWYNPYVDTVSRTHWK